MFNIPKEKEVPLGCVTPAPVTEQPMMMTGNWREYRPVIDHEKCDLCMNCVVFCPDACCCSWTRPKRRWSGTRSTARAATICVNECATGALSKAYELDFEDGVVRLEKPF